MEKEKVYFLQHNPKQNTNHFDEMDRYKAPLGWINLGLFKGTMEAANEELELRVANYKKGHRIFPDNKYDVYDIYTCNGCGEVHVIDRPEKELGLDCLAKGFDFNSYHNAFEGEGGSIDECECCIGY